MNTATQTASTTETADRFRCEADVPDPPRDPAGRKQYWEDTVAEAVAELRRRLASTFDQKSFQALQMILDLEKTRLRHKAPVAGTEVASRFDDGLESLETCEEPKAEDLTPPTPPIRAGSVSDGSSQPLSLTARTEPDTPSLTLSARIEPDTDLLSYPFPPKPLRPIPLRERVKLQGGIHGHFHDHDDDDLLERGRRKCDTSAETDAVEVAVPLDTPAPRGYPKVANFDLFSPRPELP